MSALELYLLSDNHSYSETMSTINQIDPDEVQTRYHPVDRATNTCSTVDVQILLHDASRSKVLSRKVEKECRDDARVLYISRQVIHMPSAYPLDSSSLKHLS